MLEHSFSLNGWTQLLAIDPATVEGAGNSSAPQLHIPCTWILNPTGSQDQSRGFYIQYVVATVRIPGTSDIARAIIPFNCAVRSSGRTSADRPAVFDLTPAFVENIEAVRSGDQMLMLRFAVYGVEARQITADGQRVPVLLAEPAEGQVEIRLTISQSHWAGKILPVIGLSPMCLIELPLKNAVFPEESSIAAAELREAVEYFRKSDFDKVVGHCRSAFEPLKKALPGLKGEIDSGTEFAWIKDSVDATWTWLDTMLKRLQSLSSKTHHPPSFGHFGREDARTILMVTAALVSYSNRISIK